MQKHRKGDASGWYCKFELLSNGISFFCESTKFYIREEYNLFCSHSKPKRLVLGISIYENKPKTFKGSAPSILKGGEHTAAS